MHYHGIQNEQSDIRAHVGVLARKMFVFQTRDGAELIARGRYRPLSATQPGVNGPTASGYAPRLSDFSDLRIIDGVPDALWEDWSDRLPTGEKGRRAVEVVVWALAHGRFPLWVAHQKDEGSLDIQINGTDIVVSSQQRIQVKCDYRAGRREDHPSCTGRLFLQVMERNPLGVF